MPIAKPRLHHCKMQKISLPFANTHTCDSTSCKTNTLQPIFTAVMHLRQAVNRLARTRIIRCKMVRPNITRQYPKWFGLKTSLSLSLLYGVSNLSWRSKIVGICSFCGRRAPSVCPSNYQSSWYLKHFRLTALRSAMRWLTMSFQRRLKTFLFPRSIRLLLALLQWTLQ